MTQSRLNDALHWAAVLLILTIAAVSYSVHASIERLRELFEAYSQ